MNIKNIFNNSLSKIDFFFINRKLKKDLKIKNVRVSKKANVLFAKINFEGNNLIADFTKISGNLNIGYCTTIGINCNFNGNISIGKYCQIGGYVGIYSNNHPSNHLAIYTGSNFFEGDLKVNTEIGNVIIGNDVWIGHGVTILKDVVIADGVIIGSGAVVTKDVPPYAIIAGVPAKVLKYRFSDELIATLLATNWWNLDKDQLNLKKQFFSKPINNSSDVQGF